MLGFLIYFKAQLDYRLYLGGGVLYLVGPIVCAICTQGRGGGGKKVNFSALLLLLSCRLLFKSSVMCGMEPIREGGIYDM